MLKVKTFVILIIIYIISFIAIKVDLNLFYPYYLLKDLVYFKVEAEEIILSDEVTTGINLELKAELEELKKINDISNTLTDFDSVKAAVVERNRMYWFNTITINKGSSSGIKENMAVITGDGLIGRVSKVGNNTSEVKLITTSDVNNKISVMIKTIDDTIYGVMSGYNSDTNTLQVSSTNKKFDNLENSLVYTSGMGGVFPSGILIGNVTTIENDKYEVSKIINVKPSSQIYNFRFVNVLIRK
ncbi:MAG: rod shape-determining protein MreC [Bacilli bacterium]|nr:rod shape-determining protein MreC [Bacilli bacterium]